MSEENRHSEIRSLLLDQPFLSVNDLVAYLGVSPATVRRDIDKLDELGFAKKVYGGIIASGASRRRAAIALPFSDNRDIAVDAKRSIGREAARLVRDGSIIVVHGGSTCFHFGVEIADRNVRVLTHSMPLAGYLAEYGTCQLTVGGGDLHREPGILCNASAPVAPNFFASQFFVGALGVDSRGCLESHPLLVKFVQDFAEVVNEVVLLVDSRKFEERAPKVALPLQRIARIITDDGLSDVHARMLEDQGVAFTTAPVSGGTREKAG
ncbi:DeoR/GlpR family DNA-binding transcription regulator [Roseivivax isoporae]|uniref:ArsR family transcriptional regulator n=1 Tax=Roseivivax isoporae LMG 25204 TaxID=1449351 RepID=X7F461_9RHOB|nr:DeoR/GlpR family DNA-binding transcription regulator [Roseivivax isoporae]ETX27707.1 ArsR family transcriptional regulator [Roseivivax isoporae LMG 25204]